MRRIMLLLAAAIVVVLTAAPAAFAQANDQDCKDFPSQASAQAHLEADPSDPDNLDADDDGLACENFGYAGDGGDGAPSDGDDGALPFTGPEDRQLPLGATLVGAGLVLVAATQRRYRARHLRR
jgi:Excalibur calcium-binding domain